MAYLVRCPCCHRPKRVDPPGGATAALPIALGGFRGHSYICPCGVRLETVPPRDGQGLGYAAEYG